VVYWSGVTSNERSSKMGLDADIYAVPADVTPTCMMVIDMESVAYWRNNWTFQNWMSNNNEGSFADGDLIEITRDMLGAWRLDVINIMLKSDLYDDDHVYCRGRADPGKDRETIEKCKELIVSGYRLWYYGV
jgi:hypothetical protein